MVGLRLPWLVSHGVYGYARNAGVTDNAVDVNLGVTHLKLNGFGHGAAPQAGSSIKSDEFSGETHILLEHYRDNLIARPPV